MKWVEIEKVHINTDHIETFSWFEGELHIFFRSDRNEVVLDDPDRRNYIKLCRLMGIRPVLED